MNLQLMMERVWSWRRAIRDRSAFSLIGVVVAVAIMAVAVIPLVGLVGSGARRSAVAEDRFHASRLALRLLEYYSEFPALAEAYTGSEDLVFDTLVMDDNAHLLPISTLSEVERQALVSGAVRLNVSYRDAIVRDGDSVPTPGLGMLQIRVHWSTANEPRSFVARQLIKTQ